MLRPPSCCPIRGSTGLAPYVGPPAAKIAFLGEALGRTESFRSEPFVGEAGFVLDRLLEQVDLPRSSVLIGNRRLCRPPGDWLVNAPWENAACEHCDGVFERFLESRPRDSVIVALGGYALRALMGYQRVRGKEEGGIRVQDFHGAPVRHPRYPVWIVPTFHPSFLNRTALRLFKTAIFDLSVAKELATGKWEYDLPSLVIDPPPEWVEAWVAGYCAAAAADPDGVWLAVDVETPDKSKAEDELEDASWEILYLNLSCSPDEGITFPWCEPYISIARRALEAGGRQVYHNHSYDVKRLLRAGIAVRYDRVWDSMNAWRVLHRTHPAGLGYIAPFTSRCPPWKHLGNLNGTYRAMDGVQTLRVMRWCYARLHAEGLWPAFETMTRLDHLALRPAEVVGLPVDRPALEGFNEKMQAICASVEAELQPLVPEEVKPLAGPLVRRPDDGDVVERQQAALVKVCGSCKKEGVHAKHRCEDKSLVPNVGIVERVVARYYRREPFNPASPKQVLAYIKFRKHKPGRAKKTLADSTDKKTLARLAKTGDPVYPLLQRHRVAGKMGGTYGAGLLSRLDAEGRLHGEMGHATKSGRLQSKSPNLQNLAHHVQYADDFRRCIIAAPGCRLVSVDFSAIEAVETGWYCGDPEFIRLAKLSIHSYVMSHAVGQPVDLKWSNADILTAFREQRGQFPGDYDRVKRALYLSLYAGTAYTIADLYPELFPKRKDAERIQAIIFEVLPVLKKWHALVQVTADRYKRLGGPGDMSHYLKYPGTPGPHPFGYRAEFYEVYRWQRGAGGKYVKRLGEDGKWAVAFFPQSTTAGVIFQAALRLFDPESPQWIGDAYFGRTPLRALIHDEVFMEVPDEAVDVVLEKTVAAMTAPIEQQPCPPAWGIGDFLTIGVAAKVGRNWAPFHAEARCQDPECEEKHTPNPDGMRSIGVEDLAADVPREEDEGEAA